MESHGSRLLLMCLLCSLIGRSSVFGRDFGDEQFSAVDTMWSLVKYVDSACIVALQQDSANILFTHCVLQFFELVHVFTLLACNGTFFYFDIFSLLFLKNLKILVVRHFRTG